MQLKSFILTALSLSATTAWLGTACDDVLKRDTLESYLDARADYLQARALVFQINVGITAHRKRRMSDG